MGDAMNDVIPVLSSDPARIEFSTLSESADQIKLKVHLQS